MFCDAANSFDASIEHQLLPCLSNLSAASIFHGVGKIVDCAFFTFAPYKANKTQVIRMWSEQGAKKRNPSLPADSTKGVSGE